MTWDTSDRRSHLPPDWSRVVVPRILERDRGICYVCHKPGADQVDHIRAGDDHRDSNLAAIHDRPCHRRKSSREGVQARGHGPLRKRPPEAHPGLKPGAPAQWRS